MKYRGFTRIASVAAWMGVAACGSGTPVAHGAAYEVVVAAPDAAWRLLGDSVVAALEAPVDGARRERSFEVVRVAPDDPAWRKLRRFRQVVVIGDADDAWVRPVLRHGSDGGAADVWAGGQRAHALVAPPDDADAALADVVVLRHRLEREFRARTRERMFASGADVELRRSLLARHGFGITVPRAYGWAASDSAVVLRSDWPSPDRRTRSVLVARSDAPAADAAALLEERRRLARRWYATAQRTLDEPVAVRRTARGELEVRGAWSAPPGYPPAGGPFIARSVACPDGRAYTLDAWLYAPGENKFEYVVQLETILDSFSCSD